MNKEVIIALDFPNKEETYKFLKNFPTDIYIKVGMELFYKEGFSFVKELKDQGYKIFLDLKLYDIPVTVQKALLNLKELEVELLTIHLSGGEDMLSLASEVFANSSTKLLGVTLLTSLDVTQTIKTDYSKEEVLINLVEKARNSQIPGIICSAQDLGELIAKFPELIYITPGIRNQSDNKNDQKRVVTPRDAGKLGSDAIVVGRSITQSKNPYEMYLQMKKEFQGEDNE